MTFGGCRQVEGVSTYFGVAPLLACGARLAMIAADLTPAAGIAGLLLRLALPAQDVFDLIPVHECCKCENGMSRGVCQVYAAVHHGIWGKCFSEVNPDCESGEAHRSALGMSRKIGQRLAQE